MGCATANASSPFGPLTLTSPSATFTATPLGTLIASRPILLIVSLPHERHDFAAEAHALGLLAAHDALRRRHDDEPEPAHALRDLALRRVEPKAGLADSLQTVDDALSVRAVFERDPYDLARRAGHDFEILDETLGLEDLRDLFLQPRHRDVDPLVERRVGVADAGEHIGDGVGRYHVPSSNLLVANSRSPRRLRDAGDLAHVRALAEADAAQAELAQIAARAT